MDWSLALVSQGIEATIERSPERERWVLLVPPQDLARAQECIRLYRTENRGWSWRKQLPGADLDLHWGAIVFCVVLALVHSFSAYQAPVLELRGTMNPEKVMNGEWWRLFTAVFLHSDMAHLMANVSFGIVVLGLAMGRFGAGFALLFTLLAGAMGNVAGLAFHARPYIGLGASGMMMGALGVLAIHSIALWRDYPRAARYIMSGVSAGFIIFVMFGVSPNSDVLAHFAGFLAGMLFGAILALGPAKVTRSRLADRAAFILFLTISLTAWILALR